MSFKPVFSYTKKITEAITVIERIKHEIAGLPITPTMLASLRETARLASAHYSTKIEGNRLTQEQVIKVIKEKQHFVGRQRDEWEVKGYYVALDFVEKYAQKDTKSLPESVIKKLHGLVMGGGKITVTPTPYRDGQNVIRDGLGNTIYLPPESKDVPALMKELALWINSTPELVPVIAAIAHYQFATIHPYYDGNGRTARLLVTLIMHMRGYDLKGIYSLDAYYANNLAAYYDALTVGPSVIYYEGRAEADITHWVEYFCAGLVVSFENIHAQALAEASRGATDSSKLLRQLNMKQRVVLELLRGGRELSSVAIGKALALQERTARNLCQKWVGEGFLITVDPSSTLR